MQEENNKKELRSYHKERKLGWHFMLFCIRYLFTMGIKGFKEWILHWKNRLSKNLWTLKQRGQRAFALGNHIFLVEAQHFSGYEKKKINALRVAVNKNKNIKTVFIQQYKKTKERIQATGHSFYKKVNKKMIKKSLNQLKENKSYRHQMMSRSLKGGLALSIVMSMCLTTVSSAHAESKVTQLISGKNTSGDRFIGGNYIELGISSIGSFGSVGSAPSNFHNTDSNLLPQTTNRIGMIANENGWYSGIKSKTNDFFMPGTIDEGWTVGINGSSKAYASAANTATSRKINIDDNFSTDFIYNEKKEVIGALTTGTIFNGKIKVTQEVYLGVNDQLYTTKVKLENISGEVLRDVRYMRSFDPDQNSYSSYDTHNYVQNVPGVSAKVTAYGKINDAPFIFYAADSRATAGYALNGTSYVFAFNDIYNEKGYMNSANNSDLSGTRTYMDGDIFLYFDLGTLEAGQSADLTYYSSLDADTKISTEKIDAKAVDDFIEETLPELETITKDNIKEEKPKVDEAKDKFEDLSGDAKDYVSEEAKTKLEEAEKKVDGIVKEEYLDPLLDAISKLPDSKEDLTTVDDLKKVEDAADLNDKYEELVTKEVEGEKEDTWLSPDKFDSEEAYKEALDALAKLENLTKDTPPSETVRSYRLTFNVTGEQTETYFVDVIEGKNYTFKLPLSDHQRLEVTSDNANVLGTDEVIVTNVSADKTIDIKVTNTVKDLLLVNLLKVIDTITVPSGTASETVLKYLTEGSSIDDSITFAFPDFISDLLSLNGIEVKITKMYASQYDTEQTFTLTLSRDGESVSKTIKVIFEGDDTAPIITLLTSSEELETPAVSKTLKFKISDIGTGIKSSTLQVKSYLNPAKDYPLTDLGDGVYTFDVDTSDGYEISVEDYAGNHSSAVYTVNSIDKTPPAIEGVVDNAEYYLQHRIVIKDQNLKSVTMNGTTYTHFITNEEGLKTLTLEVKDKQSYTIEATDGVNNSQTTFKIVETPSDPSALNEAIKKMRDELVGQQTVLSLEEYDALDAEIMLKEQSINKLIIQGYENDFIGLKASYPTLVYNDRGQFDTLLENVNNGANYYGKLTEEVNIRRENLIKEINAYLQPLRDELNIVTGINQTLDRYSALTIGSKDKEIIERYQQQLNEINTSLLESGSSNPVLLEAQAKATLLIEAINELSNAITALELPIKSLTVGNIKSSDKAAVEEVIAQVKAYQITGDHRLSIEDKGILEAILIRADALLTRIKEVTKTFSENTAIIEQITVDTVTLESYQQAKSAYAKLEELHPNLTSEETTKLTKLKEHLEALKNKVDLDSIADIDSTISDLTVATVTEDQRATITKVIAAIDELLALPATTENQKVLLNQKRTNAQTLIDQLDIIQGAINQAVEALNSYEIKNINSNQTLAIETAQQAIQKVKTDYLNQLSVSQIEVLDLALAKGETLLAKITEVAEKIEKINQAAAIDLNTVTSTNQPMITEALGAILDITANLTADEAASISGHKEKLENLNAKIEEVIRYLNKLKALSSIDIGDITTDILKEFEDIQKLDYSQHLTLEQKTTIDVQISKIKELTQQLDNIDDAIMQIENQLSAITLSNIKTSDETQVLSAQTALNAFPYVQEILTVSQKERLTKLAENINAFITKMNTLHEQLSVIENLLQNLTEMTVKTTDAEAIALAKEKITELLDIAKDNLLVSQINHLTEDLNNKIPALEAKIKEANDALKAVEDALAGFDSSIFNQTYQMMAVSGGINFDNVNLEHESMVNQAIMTIEEALLNTSLSESAVEQLNHQLVVLNQLKDCIQDIRLQMNIIDHHLENISAKDVTSDDQDKIAEVKKAIDQMENNYQTNMNEDQKESIANEKTKIETMDAILLRVEEALSNVEDVLNGYDESTIKETDLETIKKIEDQIDAIKKEWSQNLSDDEQTQLTEHQTTIDQLENKVEALQKKLQAIEEAIKDFTEDNVVISDKDKVDSIADQIESVHNDYQNNLSEKNKTDLEKQSDKADTLLTKIEDSIKLNKQLKQLDSLDFNTVESMEQLKEWIHLYDQLSPQQQTQFDKNKMDYCRDVIQYGLVDEIKNEDAAIVGIDGTKFINGTQLHIKDVFNKLDTDTNQQMNNSLNTYFNGYELIALYDIHLTYKEVLIQPDGKITIILKVPGNIDQYEDIKAVYVSDNGDVVEYPFIIKEGFIYIETDHFSYYGIIAKAKETLGDNSIDISQNETQNETVDTSDTTLIDAYALMGLVSLGAAAWIEKKKYLR